MSFGLDIMRKDNSDSVSRRKNVLFAQFHPPHFYEILCYFCHALLALVNRKVRPMEEFIVDLVI